MNGLLASQRLHIQAHRARIAETAPPASVRTAADPRWRRMVSAIGHLARSARRVARRILVVPGPEPVAGATPAMLGRHPRPAGPPC